MRVGTFRDDWTVESITPRPISVFDDSALRKLARQYKRAKGALQAQKVPAANLLQFWTPPHKKYPGQSWDPHNMVLTPHPKNKGEWVLWRGGKRRSLTSPGRDYVALDPAYWGKPGEVGPFLPVWVKRDKTIGRAPKDPPQGASRDKWIRMRKAQLLWAWRYGAAFTGNNKEYFAKVKQVEKEIKAYNVNAKEKVRDARKEARKLFELAELALQEQYESQRRRIRAAYKGANYDPSTGRRIESLYK